MTPKKILTAIGILTLMSGVFLYIEAPVPVSDDFGKIELFNTQSVYTDCNLISPRETDIATKLTTYRVMGADNSLRSLEAKDKANFKGCEIAKIGSIPRVNVKFSGADYDIEIVSMEPIAGGVQVFARAWNPEGKQVGFGKDGTIDIERFRIFNPPILVDDPLGDIVRTWVDEKTGEVKTRTLREDPVEALKQSLVHTISTVGVDGANIIAGSRGNTTSSFYGVAGTGSTISDTGWFEDRYTVWSTTRDGASSRIVYPTTHGTDNSIGNGNGANYYTILRAASGFDTSTIPDADIISSATLSLYGLPGTITGTNDYQHIVAFTGSLSTVVVGGYSALGSTSYGNGASPYNQSGYNNISLNATGIAAISKTDVTKLGIKGNHDFSNITPSASDDATINAYAADDAGTSRDPYLTVVHSSAATTPTTSIQGDISIQGDVIIQ